MPKIFFLNGVTTRTTTEYGVWIVRAHGKLQFYLVLKFMESLVLESRRDFNDTGWILVHCSLFVFWTKQYEKFGFNMEQLTCSICFEIYGNDSLRSFTRSPHFQLVPDGKLNCYHFKNSVLFFSRKATYLIL